MMEMDSSHKRNKEKLRRRFMNAVRDYMTTVRYA